MPSKAAVIIEFDKDEEEEHDYFLGLNNWNYLTSYTIEKSRRWFEVCHAIFTITYAIIMLTDLSNVWGWDKLAVFVALFIVLTILPFYPIHVFQAKSRVCIWILSTFGIRSSHIRTAISAIPLFVSIIIFESYIGGQSHLVQYYSITVLFRLVGSRFVYDGIAVSVVYAINVVALNTEYEVDFLTISRLVLLAGVLLGLLCGNILYRAGKRIWEHVRLLIVLDRKAKRERALVTHISLRHFTPKEFQQIRRNCGSSSDSSPSDPLQCPSIHNTNQPHLSKDLSRLSADKIVGLGCDKANDVVPSPTNDTMENRPIISAARSAGIIFTPPIPNESEDEALTAKEIRSLDGYGLQRKNVTVITFKVVIEEDNEYEVNNQLIYGVYDWLDRVASKYGVSACRRFGEIWIGCIGFFGPPTGPVPTVRGDCFQAVQLGCEAMLVANRLRLRLVCAVEAGKLDCGFHQGSFELFGPEMR